MKKIHFGFQIDVDPLQGLERASYVADLNRALSLISGHFDSAWIIDHLQDVSLESFTALAYLAALHPRLTFGHTVVCQSFRNPALVAKMGATMQLLSGGRFVLGIGTGWHEAEYRAFGYEFPPARVRVEQLEEAVQIIRAMWREEKATFLGKHYRIVDVGCEPRPDPVPALMIGTFKPKMLRLTAKYADDWNVSSTGIQGYQRLSEEMERACAEVGRDPATLSRSWCGGCACQPTQAAAEGIAGERYSSANLEEDFGFVGTPGQVIAQMRPFIEMGVSTFMLDCGGFPDLTTLELLIREVLPALNA